MGLGIRKNPKKGKRQLGVDKEWVEIYNGIVDERLLFILH